MLKIADQLDEQTEEIIHRVIGCCIAVHRELGPGLLESICGRAICIELHEASIPFDSERSVPVRYRGHLLCRQRLDIVADNRVLLEIKAVDRIARIHQAQVLSYLRITGLRVGLLINFNVPVLPEGLQRIVL